MGNIFYESPNVLENDIVKCREILNEKQKFINKRSAVYKGVHVCANSQPIFQDG